MRTGICLHATVWVIVVALLSLAARAIADDAAPAAQGGEVAKPSVEELAVPPQQPAETARESDTREAMCLMIESAAKANDLPLEFFARVIWQESRFQSDAVGPMTRRGQRAQGIAQFMPGTASERRLLDPFDPVQALPKSAEFLSELRSQFGNLGLAAAAYNAGPRRVQDWLAGTGPMPQETRNYVVAITGSTVDEWATAGRNGKMPDRAPTSSCRALMALLRRAPNPFVTQLEQRAQHALLVGLCFAGWFVPSVDRPGRDDHDRPLPGTRAGGGLDRGHPLLQPGQGERPIPLHRRRRDPERFRRLLHAEPAKKPHLDHLTLPRIAIRQRL